MPFPGGLSGRTGAGLIFPPSQDIGSLQFLSTAGQPVQHWSHGVRLQSFGVMDDDAAALPRLAIATRSAKVVSMVEWALAVSYPAELPAKRNAVPRCRAAGRAAPAGRRAPRRTRRV